MVLSASRHGASQKRNHAVRRTRTYVAARCRVMVLP